MTDLDGSGFRQLDRMLDLVRRTRELLDRVVDERELRAEDVAFLESTTLPHVEGIQAGFHGSLRSDAAGASELQYLLLQVAGMRVEEARTEADRSAALAEATAEARLAGRRLADGGRPRPALSGAEPWHLAALHHARVVLAFLPRVPEDDVRFPAGRRSYADIPTPRGPAELAGRIAELEGELWKAVTGRPSPPVDPAFRRTYGFFDAADRLGVRAFRGAA
ncbi:MAG TPA: hypothetical protein VM344_09370 [Vitreimonas sp.]|nr:hypothetical protein [Vitreimonas sp.]